MLVRRTGYAQDASHRQGPRDAAGARRGDLRRGVQRPRGVDAVVTRTPGRCGGDEIRQRVLGAVFDALDWTGVEPMVAQAQHAKQIKSPNTDVADSAKLARIV